MNVLLKGIVGSTAYGLAREGSDVDHLGVFAESTSTVLGLHAPKDSVVTKDPDTTMHEAKKFVALCLNGNPSVSEVLWLDSYEEVSEGGLELVELRRKFLSAKRVRDAYLGYAVSQFGRLKTRGDGSFSADTRKRTEKHARHLIRLVEQGFRLYRSGELVVNLRSSASEIDPDWVFSMGQQLAEKPEMAETYMRNAEARFDRATSPLPGQPDVLAVEKWLIKVRRADWGLD
ncbi:nucleotidyltransferase [Streptomyces phage Satis]|nr:nucleotidyltransferase [Streptomyces phage Satis]QPL14359.1 nucleotidyltransferase [Streptomyces phage EhyElimayoE]